MTCPICGASKTETIYRGAIRAGRFGSKSAGPRTVSQCSSCSAGFLDSSSSLPDDFYTSDLYRNSVDGGQRHSLSVLPVDHYRGKVVADVGCGEGSFLDCVSGVAEKVIAIEPSASYRDALADKGYETFAFCANALERYASAVDTVVSFAVVEHVSEPVQFLEDIHALLKEGGEVLISTPNLDDALLTALPEEFGAFFFREAHLWYFDKRSLENLLRLSGFDQIEVIPFHRFGLDNFLKWLYDKAPGTLELPFVTAAMNTLWRKELERLGVSDYLFAKARK